MPEVNNRYKFFSGDQPSRSRKTVNALLVLLGTLGFAYSAVRYYAGIKSEPEFDNAVYLFALACYAIPQINELINEYCYTDAAQARDDIEASDPNTPLLNGGSVQNA